MDHPYTRIAGAVLALSSRRLKLELSTCCCLSHHQVVKPLLPVVMIAVLADALILDALVYGPAISERADQFQAEQTDQENRAALKLQISIKSRWPCHFHS
jgi:hypothetical protein